ncbi:Glycoside hydrolase-type carbohydrate-binding, subgroup [Corchorus olitorius]|uniref:Glycoside hydrolase-type carbohydrate-binding, subgroup n=1 Tax=Corchorus olitorius TaxID=93759 RepID=A0A1R3GYF1_9ROSI|nr:Glycoside hydrolase-type carbohydrate-binding, subgroup [Corchorus olitorius]
MENPLNGVDYSLPLNKLPNSLHGRFKGFDKEIWEVVEHRRAMQSRGYCKSAQFNEAKTPCIRNQNSCSMKIKHAKSQCSSE